MQPTGQPNQAQAWAAYRKKAIIIIIVQIGFAIAILITGIVRQVKDLYSSSVPNGIVAIFAGMITLMAGCAGCNAVRFIGARNVAIAHAAISVIAILLSIVAFGFACKDLSLAGSKVCKRSFFSSYYDCESVDIVPSVFLVIFLLGGIAVGGYRLFLYYKEMKSGENSTLPSNVSQPAQYGTGSASYAAVPPGAGYPTTGQPYPPTGPTAYASAGHPPNVSQPAQFDAGSAASTAVPSGPGYVPPGQPYPPTGTTVYPTAGQPYQSTPVYPSAQTAYPPPPGPVCSQQYPQTAPTAPYSAFGQPQQPAMDPNLPPPPSYSETTEEVKK